MWFRERSNFDVFRSLLSEQALPSSPAGYLDRAMPKQNPKGPGNWIRPGLTPFYALVDLKYGVATNDLLPGVEMALFAMTTHAVLQQHGCTLSPFQEMLATTAKDASIGRRPIDSCVQRRLS